MSFFMLVCSFQNNITDVFAASKQDQTDTDYLWLEAINIEGEGDYSGDGFEAHNQARDNEDESSDNIADKAENNSLSIELDAQTLPEFVPIEIEPLQVDTLQANLSREVIASVPDVSFEEQGLVIARFADLQTESFIEENTSLVVIEQTGEKNEVETTISSLVEPDASTKKVYNFDEIDPGLLFTHGQIYILPDSAPSSDEGASSTDEQAGLDEPLEKWELTLSPEALLNPEFYSDYNFPDSVPSTDEQSDLDEPSEKYEFEINSDYFLHPEIYSDYYLPDSTPSTDEKSNPDEPSEKLELTIDPEVLNSPVYLCLYLHDDTLSNDEFLYDNGQAISQVFIFDEFSRGTLIEDFLIGRDRIDLQYFVDNSSLLSFTLNDEGFGRVTYNPTTSNDFGWVNIDIDQIEDDVAIQIDALSEELHSGLNGISNTGAYAYEMTILLEDINIADLEFSDFIY